MGGQQWSTGNPTSTHPDPKQSLQHILTTTTDPPVKSKPRPQDQATPNTPSKPDAPSKQSIIWIDGEPERVEDKEDQASIQNDSDTRAAEYNLHYYYAERAPVNVRLAITPTVTETDLSDRLGGLRIEHRNGGMTEEWIYRR